MPVLQLLGLPKCSQDIQEEIKYLQESISKTRESRGYQVKLEVKFSVVW